MATISLRNLTKRWGDVIAVDDQSLEIEDTEFLVLLGPSGCGKTTTMRMIAGLEQPSAGEIWIGDRLVNDELPKDRDVAMVFQNYGLYPHMTVFGNIAYPLKVRRTPATELRERVGAAAEKVQLGDLLDRNATRAFGRSATTRCPRQGDRAPSPGLPDGRAAQQSRRQAQGHHAGRAEASQP